MGFRIIFDLNNGQDRNIGPTVVKTLGEARAILIEQLSRPATENARFAVLETDEARGSHARELAMLYINAIVKVLDLPVGEHLPMAKGGQFYYIEEVPDRD